MRVAAPMPGATVGVQVLDHHQRDVLRGVGYGEKGRRERARRVRALGLVAVDAADPQHAPRAAAEDGLADRTAFVARRQGLPGPGVDGGGRGFVVRRERLLGRRLRRGGKRGAGDGAHEPGEPGESSGPARRVHRVRKIAAGEAGRSRSLARSGAMLSGA